jgi:non-specific serine/threonine protein kinase
MTALSPVLSPRGVLSLKPADDAPALDAGRGARLAQAFARGPGHGLLSLGADEVGTSLPPQLAYWREFSARYVASLCALPGLGENERKPALPVPADDELDAFAAGVPPMVGAEYLTTSVLADLWRATDAAFDAELHDAGVSVQAFLKARHPAWNLVGRVHFNLAENRKDEDAPFAFLATYTTRLSAQAKAQHLPLGKALQEYAGQRDRLLSLLLPVQRAAEQCPWLKTMVEAGEIYHPLRWRPHQAMRFLQDVPTLEAAGVVVRMPANWRLNRPARPQVKVTVGGKAPSQLGLDALLDFRMEVTLDGDTLTPAEIERLLTQSDGLAFIRGRWVEIDRERLRRTLDRFAAVEQRAGADGLSFGEAMRLLAGAGLAGDAAAPSGDADWASAVAGPWLAQTLAELRHPDGSRNVDPGRSLRGVLRPYQLAGVQWLHLLARLGLGACLADDMGLGKTIQILALLLVLKQQDHDHKPSLLVAPASLLANWAAEIARFAPDLKALVVHPSAMPADELAAGGGELETADLVITSYGFLARVPRLTATSWRLAVVDEAQAIKNPGTKQTRTVKKLRADARIALTGTPIENRLSDLWSIFDFVNPGLLGSSKQFSSYVKRLADGASHNPYAPLRELVRPYVLRRMKTDKSIIADLPDKTEVKAFCGLSRRQAALYRQAVDELADRLDDADGIERRGVVLAALMRLKQICNHPSQWLGDDAWAEEDSGKFARLRDITEEIAARQEKALVFTQFRETTAPLAAFLGSVFGREGLILTGETPVAKRKDLVRRFQEDDDVPFFVVSVKAGGAGLNLTAASHVIHFDRWWNPAVENQATDRAFRIGQTRNVLVHKFVCRGTVEEKIDAMIEAKQQLAGDFLTAGAETALTEMKDDELMKLVSLDLAAAMKES